jgi:uncharacterized surface protein with fasciclin (FAS1) repeats
MVNSIKTSLLSLFISAHVVFGQNLTFREIIDADPDYSTFARALDTAALDFAMYGFPLTLFAPDNAAFDNVDAVLFSRLFAPGFGAHLKYVLETHIVRGAFPTSSLPIGETPLEAVNGVTIIFQKLNRRALQATYEIEIESSDGIFYGINEVLLTSDIAETFILNILP